MKKGKLTPYFETGMEGFEWAFEENGKEAYDGLNFLKEGDRLRIYDAGKKVWEGEIKYDLTSNLTSDTAYRYPRQVFENMIVHWFQQGVSPEQWAQWFIQEKEGELEKKTQE